MVQSTDLIAAGTVNTQDGFKELNITAVPVSGETIVEVSTPLITANVIKADITACKVFTPPASSRLTLTISKELLRGSKIL